MLNKSTIRSTSTAANSVDARDVYALLMEPRLSSSGRSASRLFLQEKLEQAAQLPIDMPTDAKALAPWMEQKALGVGERYSRYLEQRKAGEPRQFFANKAHALTFLRHVAPTKLVDGAWLYGTLQNWEDPRFHPLIRTYLEELGDGDPAQNHVVLYRQLLKENGCDELPALDDDHYIQGAIQLALGHHSEQFMPELIGYNLGYEQLPLHLLITAFELAELNIDPYYFTLHVTVDNASTGHARKAVQAVIDCLPTAGDPTAFLQRVADGYRLNDLGLGATDVINGFSLEQELVAMLERKSSFGKHMHSDFCSIGGRTVNEWLATPGQTRNFINALEAKGWIKRHDDPSNSRFWRLVDGPKAPMAGVFSHYEKQLLRDWIAGEWTSGNTAADGAVKSVRQTPRKRRTFRRYKGAKAELQTAVRQRQTQPGDLDQDIKDLDRELQLLPEALRMQRLISLMAPSKHPTAAGLYATRQFAGVIR